MADAVYFRKIIRECCQEQKELQSSWGHFGLDIESIQRFFQERHGIDFTEYIKGCNELKDYQKRMRDLAIYIKRKER